MSDLLTFPAPRLPFDCLTKLLAALVLLEVWAARVVVGTTKLLAEHTPVAASSRTTDTIFSRRIRPQERSKTEDLASFFGQTKEGTRASRFPSSGLIDYWLSFLGNTELTLEG